MFQEGLTVLSVVGVTVAVLGFATNSYLEFQEKFPPPPSERDAGIESGGEGDSLLGDGDRYPDKAQ